MLLFTPCSKNRSNDGFIIVAVLWILGALAALAVVYSIYVRQAAVEFVIILKAPLGVAATFLTLQVSKTDRVTVDVQFLSGYRIRFQVVIFLLDDDRQPYRALSWRHDEPSIDERDETGMR